MGGEAEARLELGFSVQGLSEWRQWEEVGGPPQSESSGTSQLPLCSVPAASNGVMGHRVLGRASQLSRVTGVLQLRADP